VSCMNHLVVATCPLVVIACRQNSRACDEVWLCTHTKGLCLWLALVHECLSSLAPLQRVVGSSGTHLCTAAYNASAAGTWALSAQSYVCPIHAPIAHTLQVLRHTAVLFCSMWHAGCCARPRKREARQCCSIPPSQQHCWVLCTPV
jgi:hypothetical protein